jgi:putative methyltransferase (TIGR04325 family)
MSTDQEDPCVWDGIIDSFPESEADHVWDSERWVTSVFKALSLPGTSGGADKTAPSELSLVHEYPLPPIAALLATYKTDLPLRILDFGGGSGNSFMACMNSLSDPQKIEYHIVEGKRICEKGREIYVNFNNVYYHDFLPVCENRFHIVHIAAALHYIRDWRELLKQLLNYQPDVLMLNALNAGDIKTFVSFQNYYGEKIPVWFWNISEVTEYVQSLNYQLIYKSLLEFSFLGKIQPLPMQNFPPEYRLARKCNLIFGAPTLGD